MATGFPAPTAGRDSGQRHHQRRHARAACFRHRQLHSAGLSRRLHPDLEHGPAAAIARKFTLEAAYVANHTVRAPVTYNLNASFLFNSGSNGKPFFPKYNKNTDIN